MLPTKIQMAIFAIPNLYLLPCFVGEGKKAIERVLDLPDCLSPCSSLLIRYFFIISLKLYERHLCQKVMPDSEQVVFLNNAWH